MLFISTVFSCRFPRLSSLVSFDEAWQHENLEAVADLAESMAVLVGEIWGNDDQPWDFGGETMIDHQTDWGYHWQTRI